jgi:hypothetical protein
MRTRAATPSIKQSGAVQRRRPIKPRPFNPTHTPCHPERAPAHSECVVRALSKSRDLLFLVGRDLALQPCFARPPMWRALVRTTHRHSKSRCPAHRTRAAIPQSGRAVQHRHPTKPLPFNQLPLLSSRAKSTRDLFLASRTFSSIPWLTPAVITPSRKGGDTSLPGSHPELAGKSAVPCGAGLLPCGPSFCSVPLKNVRSTSIPPPDSCLP